ncbi:MAG: hypothetical protein AAFY26_27840, partial [Cyanobacteria bacterium J06638_22]
VNSKMQWRNALILVYGVAPLVFFELQPGAICGLFIDEQVMTVLVRSLGFRRCSWWVGRARGWGMGDRSRLGSSIIG